MESGSNLRQAMVWLTQIAFPITALHVLVDLNIRKRAMFCSLIPFDVKTMTEFSFSQTTRIHAYLCAYDVKNYIIAATTKTKRL